MNPNHSYPSSGEVIDGKYQIERILGEGGMGAVAKAMHLVRRAPVALKFMSPNVMSVGGAVERFLNEGVAASQIDSENVVHVFDVGKLPNGAPYLVMEYMEGRDLAQVIQREGHPGIEVPRAVYFIIQALRGLQVAHTIGVIHRDMKPSNCFVLEKDGEPDFVKLLDFGISKVSQGKSASLTQTNSALGTPLYMSPEQARSPRDVDLRSYLYSVGVILYELLTGRTPFTSDSGEFTEILFKLFTQDPPPIRSIRGDLSPGLAAVVHKALARDPNNRYATAADFALALEPFSDERSTRVLQRLRAHQPGRGSHAAAGAHEGSEPVAAFSKLALGTAPARTNDMPGAPPRNSADTQKLPPQPAPAQTPVRHSAFPEAAGARAQSPEDAVAATQYGGGTEPAAQPEPSLVVEPGKQTDLGATRDASVAVPLPGGKRPSPLFYPLLGALALVICGAGVWKLTAKPPPTPSSASDVTTLSPEPPQATARPIVPQEAPTGSIVVVTVDAATPTASSASATVTPTPPKKEPPAPPHPAEPRKPRLGDLKIHE